MGHTHHMKHWRVLTRNSWKNWKFKYCVSARTKTQCFIRGSQSEADAVPQPWIAHKFICGQEVLAISRVTWSGFSQIFRTVVESGAGLRFIR